MNKVMSRTTHPRPRHRPPTRHDTRRPTTAPPRRPLTNTAARRNPPPARTAPAAPAPRQRPTDLFTDRLLAVLSGRRPVHWMLRHTAGRGYDDLIRLAERSPLRTRGAHPVIHDIGYYVPRSGALEVFARIAAGAQLRALAFRLEQSPDLRWRCTAVEAR